MLRMYLFWLNSSSLEANHHFPGLFKSLSCLSVGIIGFVLHN